MPGWYHPGDSPGIKNENEISEQFISFDSKEEYSKIFEDETIISNKGNEIGFSSLKSIVSDFDVEKINARTKGNLENPADTIYDDYGVLPEILNEDKIVKIGDHLFKVDLHKEEVLVLHEEHETEYNDLVASDYDNDHIMVFSTDDEVLELLENGSSGTINGRIAGCDDRRATRKKEDRDPKNGRRKKLKAKVVYQKAGIYFSILAEGKTQKRRLRVWWRDGGGRCTIYYDCKFGVRCSWAYDEVASQNSRNGKANFRPYEGFKALEYYYLRGSFRSTHGNTDLLIRDGY